MALGRRADPAARDRAGGRSRTLIGFAAFGAVWGVWGASLPGIEQHADVGDGFFGVALALIGLGGLLSMRVAGSILDHVGQHGLAAAGLLLAAAAVLPAAAGSPAALAGALALLGVASGAFDVAVNAEGSRYETAARTPLMSLAHACFSAGVVMGSLGTAALHQATPSLVLPFALVAVALAVVSAAFTRLPSAPLTADGEQRASLPVRRLPRALLVLGVLGALAYFVENAWQSWGAVYLHRSLGASTSAAALAPASFAASAVAGRLTGQALATRTARRTRLAAGAALGGGATIAAAAAGTAPIALVAIAMAGFGTSVCAPAVMSLVGDCAAASVRASAMSIVTSLAYLGFLFGPAFVGAASAATDLRSALLAVSAVAAVLSVLALVLLDPDDASARSVRERRTRAEA